MLEENDEEMTGREAEVCYLRSHFVAPLLMADVAAEKNNNNDHKRVQASSRRRGVLQCRRRPYRGWSTVKPRSKTNQTFRTGSSTAATKITVAA